MEVTPISTLIGMTTYFVPDRELGPNRVRGMGGQNMLMATMDYPRAIARAGGTPLGIPVLTDDGYMSHLAGVMDGFVFTGGLDIAPSFYGQPVRRHMGPAAPERDAFELKLLERVLGVGKPVLAICRGMQVVNVLFGGTLHQDIGQLSPENLEHAARALPKHHPSHRVVLTEGSTVACIFGCREIWVNSLHHQAIDRLGGGLAVTATAEDGIIEAVENKDHPNLLCVQWHPEMMADTAGEQQRIFDYFLNTCNREVGKHERSA